MNSKDYLDLLMYNQKKVRDGFKFIDLNTHEEVSIEDCYENIKKDLEMLEILKEHVAINKCIYDDTKMSNCIEIVILEGDINYIKIKDWLER